MTVLDIPPAGQAEEATGLVWVRSVAGLHVPIVVGHGLRKPVLLISDGVPYGEALPYVEDARRELSTAQYESWARSCGVDPYNPAGALPHDTPLTVDLLPPNLAFPGLRAAL